MDMNDKEWNEFWDNEPDEDDDEFNDFGDDIDANNDETFDNAAEWNEDEHEEMIARDNILSHGVGHQQARKNHVMQQQQQQQQQLQQQRESYMNHPQNHQGLPQAPVRAGCQILTVDELERQLLQTRVSRPANQQPELVTRADWSPFGGKDLFLKPASPTLCRFDSKAQAHQLPAPTIISEQQILMQQQYQARANHVMQQQQQQQQQHQQQQHRQQQHQQQHQQRVNSMNHQHNHQGLPQALAHASCQILTVDELEKQLLKSRVNRPVNQPELVTKADWSSFGGEDPCIKPASPTQKRFATKAPAPNSLARQNRKRMVIIPPQVQLKVIEEAKNLGLTKGANIEESLQDRLQISRGGLHFRTQSIKNQPKSRHDGVLTVKERNWLTKIQEKIQADYDDNIDQDYYYLLYFNQSSMTDEVTQKPGPGVLDRRFIPRERLLYNANT